MGSLPLFMKYIIIFFVSMFPIVELRGAIPIAEGLRTKYIFILPNCYYRKYVTSTNYLSICKKSSYMGKR